MEGRCRVAGSDMRGEASRQVYLDHAAATPMAPEVLDAMMPFLCERFYNPSAPYAAARAVRADVERARADVAHVLGARPGTVTFTAGATEANALALASCDGHVVTDAAEHESILAGVEDRGGTLVGVDGAGRVAPQSIRDALRPDTQLVSVSLANGELGTLQPLRQIALVVADERRRRLEARERTPLLLHTDASQAAGHVSVNVSSLGVDLMTLSAAKVYGPKQVGVLWHADGVPVRPLVRGGGQEGGLRSGTENVAGVVGFACALSLAESLRATESRRLRALSGRLRSNIARELPDAVFSGPANERSRLPGLVHVSVPGVEARRVVIGLERRGVSVGTGSACAASRMRVSHVLLAIGLDDDLARGSLRLSLGRSTTEDDVDYAVDALVACVREELGRKKRGGSHV